MLFRERNTVFVVVNNMEKRGLVKKVKDPKRKNVLRVILTKKGEEVFNRARERTEVFSHIMSNLSPEERENLRTYLQRIQDRAFEKLSDGLQMAPPVAPWIPPSST